MRPWLPKLLATAGLAGVAGLPSALAAQEAAQDVATAALHHGATARDAAHAGIWKAVTPPDGSMHGEFGGNDPLGLAAGARIPADCSINWIDPDFGKLYCFSSATSLVYFLDAPRRYLARAQQHWSGQHGGS
jgi:hypothetical protein